MSAKTTVNLTVNGQRRRAVVPPMKRLLDVLREDLALPGTKEGCGEGECGACTVVMNGRTVNTCLVPAVHADGAKITTVEGLARGRSLTVLQKAFVEMGGAQCGICTPGMLVSAAALLQSMPGRVPTDAQVRDALAGNLCRCTGYQRIVDAVRAAAKPSRAAGVKKAAPRAKKSPRRATAAAKAGAKKAASRAAKAGAKQAARRAAPKAKPRAAAKRAAKPRAAAKRGAR